MPERSTRSSNVLETSCASCRHEVRVHVRGGTVEGPGSSRGRITYADTDIVVWDCPGCSTANADTVP